MPFSGFLRQRPVHEDWQDISLVGAQENATAANIANLAKGKVIASDVNTFNQDQIWQHLRKSIPNLDSILKKGSGVIESQLSGQIPQDVQDQIQRSAAAKAIGGGYGGSGMQGNLVARDLGMNSLQLTQQGLSSAERWMGSARQNLSPDLISASSMFITPGEEHGSRMINATNKANVNWTNEQLEAEYSIGNIAANDMDEFVEKSDAMIGNL